MNIARLFLLAALVGIGGCDGEGQIRPPPSTVRFYNAAASFQTVSFFREQQPIADAVFQQGATATFDSGPYDFRVQYTPPGTSTPAGSYGFAEDLSPDLDYWFIATSPNDQLEVLVASRPDSFSSETQGRISVAHADPSLGAIDVYLAAPGTALAGVAPNDSIGFREYTTPMDVAAGVYRLYFTAAQNPNDVLFESLDVDITAGSQSFVAIADAADLGTSDFIVTDIQSAPTRIVGVTENAALRVIQSVDDRLDRDVLLDGTAVPPLFATVPFGAVSDYAAIERGEHSLSLTPAGNPGALETTKALNAIAGRSQFALFAGNSAEGIGFAFFVEDRRSIVGQATLRLINGAGLFDSILVYVAPAGSNLATTQPTIQLDVLTFSGQLPFVPGEYEITALDVSTGTVLVGPQPVTLTDGGVYGVVFVNSADGNTADLVFFDDSPTP
jgi:hypothetical protein